LTYELATGGTLVGIGKLIFRLSSTTLKVASHLSATKATGLIRSGKFTRTGNDGQNAKAATNSAFPKPGIVVLAQLPQLRG
jgi:hypothetical protein